MRILATLFLLTALFLLATKTATADEMKLSELQVVGETTIVPFKASETTFSFGHLIFLSINEPQYAIVICSASKEKADKVMEEHGAIVLLPGSTAVFKTAIGAVFADGETQKITTKFVEIRCEANQPPKE